jgi:catechol 2,3-dioxygenase-like lactoylglutathione lyase family enzyme
MFAQINHVALISPQWPLLGRFYEAAFGLRLSPSAKRRPLNGITVVDGRVGLNINPRRDRLPAGLDHFGFGVDDVETVLERMRRKYPEASFVKRPSTRPFAAYTGADPDGNTFDLAQKKNDTRIGIYADQASGGWEQERYINKFAIRTLHPEPVAEFYRDVFELTPLNRPDVPGFHLSDGRVALSILPWSLALYEGTAVLRPGPDHFGFKVENLDSFQQQVREIAGLNFHFAPVPLGGSKETDRRKQIFAESATGKLQMADPEGNWLDVTDE